MKTKLQMRHLKHKYMLSEHIKRILQLGILNLFQLFVHLGIVFHLSDANNIQQSKDISSPQGYIYKSFVAPLS